MYTFLNYLHLISLVKALNLFLTGNDSKLFNHLWGDNRCFGFPARE